ncbi:hypothetical protein ACLKA7_017670 [Drosophila subpalustris]
MVFGGGAGGGASSTQGKVDNGSGSRVSGLFRQHASEENGQLYRNLGHRADDEDFIPWKLCVPSGHKRRVSQESHDAPTAGHLGVRKTVARLSQRYYWPCMLRDAARYVKRCEVCQKFKCDQRKPAGQMLTRQVTEPMAALCDDFVGPLPRSKRGNTILLVFHDAFCNDDRGGGVVGSGSRDVTRMGREPDRLVTIPQWSPGIPNCPGEPAESSHFGDAAPSRQLEDPAEAQSDPESSKMDLEDPSSPMEEVPPSSADQEDPPRVDRADPSPPGQPNPATSHTEGGSFFWDKLPTRELEVDPESKFPCIRIRFKPGVVNNARLTRNEENTRARPRSTRRKRQHRREGALRARESGGSRKRRRSFPAETKAPSDLTRQISAEEDPPIPEEAAVGGEPASKSLNNVTSSTDSELLRDMEDMLDRWDPDLDAMFGEMADPTATLDPLIPSLDEESIPSAVRLIPATITTNYPLVWTRNRSRRPCD